MVNIEYFHYCDNIFFKDETSNVLQFNFFHSCSFSLTYRDFLFVCCFCMHSINWRWTKLPRSKSHSVQKYHRDYHFVILFLGPSILLGQWDWLFSMPCRELLPWLSLPCHPRDYLHFCPLLDLLSPRAHVFLSWFTFSLCWSTSYSNFLEGYKGSTFFEALHVQKIFVISFGCLFDWIQLFFEKYSLLPFDFHTVINKMVPLPRF